jgi:hypothetical protein
MEFTAFLNAIVKVAELLFYEVVDDPGSALIALFDHHIIPLFNKL